MVRYRITDEMREHIFDNWPEEALQYHADDRDCTIPEVKERLLEFAASLGLDTLDSFLARRKNKVNSISQLDGAPIDLHTFSFQTPTMTSPTSQSSDDCDSVFDNRGSPLATPSSQYTPANFKVAENGSPMRGSSSQTKLTCQTDGPDELTESHDRTQIELEYNPHRKVMHLRGDPQTLVISIEGVVYENGNAGAAVFFHQLSPWNTVTCVEKSRDNAKLEAFYIALNIISSTVTSDPTLKAVYIQCTDKDFCLALTADKQGQWLPGADETTLSEIDQLWRDILKGSNGRRPVDVQLRCVSEEEMRPVTETALAYMYEQHGRDWYAENGRDWYAEHGNLRDRFEENPSSACPQYDSVVAPQAVVDQGPQAASKWVAEAKARLKQSFLHKMVASAACHQLNGELRASKELMSTERFLDTYAMATKLTAEDPQKDIDQFMAEQRVIREGRKLLPGQLMANRGRGDVKFEEVGDQDEKLVQEVLEMEMDWE